MLLCNYWEKNTEKCIYYDETNTLEHCSSREDSVRNSTTQIVSMSSAQVKTPWSTLTSARGTS